MLPLCYMFIRKSGVQHSYVNFYQYIPSFIDGYLPIKVNIRTQNTRFPFHLHRDMISVSRYVNNYIVLSELTARPISILRIMIAYRFIFILFYGVFQ